MSATAHGAAEVPWLSLDGAFVFFFEKSNQAYYVFDPGTLRILAVNEASVRRYGYSREEFLGITLEQLRPPEDVPRFLATVARSGVGAHRAGRFRHLARDGQILNVEVTTNDISIEGRPAPLVEAVDVTDQVRAELLLRESEERFRSVAENLSEGLILLDLSGHVVYANPRIRDFFLVSRDVLIGADVRSFMSAERRAKVATTRDRRMRGIVEVMEDEIARPDGSRL